MLPPYVESFRTRKNCLTHFAIAIVAIAGFWSAALTARAQTPVFRFAFDDAGPGTTTPSDPSGLTATLQMLNGAGVATDYHGPANSGVAGAITGSRALNFSSSAGQGGNGPITATTNSTLALGVISSFTTTLWIKQDSGLPANIGGRLFILANGTATDAGVANSIGLKFQTASQLAIQLNTGNPTALASFSSNLPTNSWIFIAFTYDGTNVKLYQGSESSAATLINTTAAPGLSMDLGTTTGALYVGNRRARDRSFDGWIDDVRFFTVAVDAASIENIRSTAAGNPPVVANMYPDGLKLQEGTNVLAFTASSPVGNAITNVQLVLNGLDVSSSLSISGSASSKSVSYSGLQPDKLYTAVAKVWDANGSIGTFTVNFDTFNAANFSFEAEEFDFPSGQFIDNPDYTSFPTNTSYFSLDSTELIDTHKGTGNNQSTTSCYRAGSGDSTRTQTGLATGELPRQKILDVIAAGDSNAVDHVIGFWSSSDWENYTRTFPAGKFNVYGRLSAGAGAATVRLDRVTGNWGTTSQTTTNLGSFTVSGNNYNSYQWVPLRDSFGNLATVNLEGTNTLRVTTGGGANANFYMLAPANTNLPTISNVYPDGRVLFEPTNRMVFTVSSASTTISTNSVQLTLNGVNVSSNLVFTGSSSSWNVSYTGLLPSQTYTAVITVTDANGSSASSTLNIDTYNPTMVWEAEDFDFDPNQSPVPSGTGNRYIDNSVPTTAAAANSYFGQIGVEGIDEHTAVPHTGGSPNNYRPADLVATTLVTDAARQQFVDAAAPDYNVGFLGNFFWQNYTRTFPTGTFNVYARLARGDAGAVNVTLDRITGGWGTTAQLTQRLGTFSIPGGGGWSAYLYAPLIDRFGNYANVSIGGTNTLRATVSLPVNENFYMLVPARTDLPRIDNVYPDGAVLMQRTNSLSFVASSPTFGINTTNIQVVLNGVNISSNLVFAGASASWNVSYPGLQPNTAYTAVITVTDINHKVATTTVTFDTFSTGNFNWEAEDFDFDPAQSPMPSGTDSRFIDNPVPTSAVIPVYATNSYVGQVGAIGIDENSILAPGTHLYRPSDYIATEATVDSPRSRYLDAQSANSDPTILDYDVFNLGSGAFVNYTRTYPAGNYYAYARLSGGNGAFNLALSQVTAGWGSGSQTTSYLGTFKGTGASFATWQWVPLINTNTSQRVVLSLGGTNTFQMTADGNENANFFLLAPVVQPVELTATISGGNIVLSFPTQIGLTYTVSWKNDLNDPNWTQLGSPVSGDGTIKSVSDSLSLPKRFYRLGVQ